MRGHYSIMFDGVSLGSSSFSRHETLQIVGVSFISPHSLRLHARLVGAPSAGLDHTGPVQAEGLLRCLTDHPAQLAARADSRLAAIGGDGAVVAGGPRAKHKSTNAAGHLWSLLRQDPPCLLWDGFHRDDKARRTAYMESGPTVELFDVAGAVNQLFGVGQGRIILRSAAALIDSPSYVVPQTSGTRPTVSLQAAPGALVKNFRNYHAGLHARLDLVRKGRTAQTLTGLIALARRLDSVDFVAYLLLFEDLQKMLYHHGQVQQSNKLESWIADEQSRRLLQTLDRGIKELRRLRFWVCLSRVLRG